MGVQQRLFSKMSLNWFSEANEDTMMELRRFAVNVRVEADSILAVPWGCVVLFVCFYELLFETFFFVRGGANANVPLDVCKCNAF